MVAAQQEGPRGGDLRRREFRKLLVRWGQDKRRKFFWRDQVSVDPFRILVTEILLSRTLAAVAEPVATAVLAEFPSAEAMAGAGLHELRDLLRPLGLQNKRASMLIACAQTLCDRFAGQVPRSSTKLATLPYVGPYVVDAVQCFAFRKRVPVVDINVARVYHRVFGLPEPHKRRRHSPGLREFAAKMLPVQGVALFNWTLLDLGGVICTARYPKCELCPARRMCLAHAAGTCGCRRSQNGLSSGSAGGASGSSM